MSKSLLDNIKTYSRVLCFIIITPFVIIPWMIMNPIKVWEQMKKDWFNKDNQ
jgi:hypothetical protein